jgi:hypothetical protein
VTSLTDFEAGRAASAQIGLISQELLFERMANAAI